MSVRVDIQRIGSGWLNELNGAGVHYSRTV
eukprot:SAG31_NODE_850_length_11521_cov_47.558396_3_plen_30_part_00